MTTKRRATDADYAAMAKSYEANPPGPEEVTSIEVSPTLLRKGRPAKGVASAGNTPVLAVRLPEVLRAELAHRAVLEGASASELVRRAVAEYFDNHSTVKD